jgi:hypothetical protein
MLETTVRDPLVLKPAAEIAPEAPTDATVTADAVKPAVDRLAAVTAALELRPADVSEPDNRAVEAVKSPTVSEPDRVIAAPVKVAAVLKLPAVTPAAVEMPPAPAT